MILITDGEESCKGDAKKAAAESGFGPRFTLNIVGFTLTGQATEAELGALAGSTGGRYYSAQDGAAALARGPARGAAQTAVRHSGCVREGPCFRPDQRAQPRVAPGTYRIRIDAFGQTLEESLTIVANQTTISSWEWKATGS